MWSEAAEIDPLVSRIDWQAAFTIFTRMGKSAQPTGRYRSSRALLTRTLSAAGVLCIFYWSTCGISEASETDGRGGSERAGQNKQRDQIDAMLDEAEARGAMLQKLISTIPPELIPDELKQLISPSRHELGAGKDLNLDQLLPSLHKNPEARAESGAASLRGFFDLVPVCGDPAALYLRH